MEHDHNGTPYAAPFWSITVNAFDCFLCVSAGDNQHFYHAASTNNSTEFLRQKKIDLAAAAAPHTHNKVA